MAEGLQYRVGLDAKGFQAGVNSIVTGFNTISSSGKASFKSVEALQAQLARFKRGLQEAATPESYARIVRGITQINSLLGNVKGPANNAGTALFSLSQVARDLPFGFIAIQNNLPLVVDAFASLTKQSGGVGNALKSLGGALLGPAGIGFAFSAVVSGVTALIQKYGSLTAGLNAVLGLTNATQQAQIQLAGALDEAQASTVGETAKINFLTAALQDNNRSQEERKNAYQTLKREYPGIIQNMTFENSLTEKGSALLKQRSAELIKYIQLKGREAAIIKLIEEASGEQLKAQRAISDQVSGNNQTGLDTFISGFNDFIFGRGNSLKTLAKEYGTAGDKAKFYAEQLTPVQEELNKINQEVTNFKEPPKTPQIDPNELLKAQIKSLEANLQLEEVGVVERFKIRARIIDLQEELDKREAVQSIKNRRALNATLQAIDKEAQAKRQDNTIQRATVEKGDPLSGVFGGTELQFKKLQTLLGVPLKINVDVSPVKTGLTEAELAFLTFQANAREIMANFSAQIEQIINEGAVTAIAGLGDALGDLASGKGFKLGNVFAGIGAALQQIGKTAIQTGLAFSALQKAFAVAKTQPALLIAAGIALTALGAVVKNRFSQSPGLAQGGIVPAGFPNDSFPARLTSNEAVIPLDRIDSIIGSQQGGGTLTTRVSGNDLLFIMNRTQRSQGRGG